MISTGQIIDQFKILEKLGSGGMGDVFLAQDSKLDRKVALKFLASDYFTDAERLGRFQREAKTAAQISHPNVTAIYDLGTFKDPNSDAESLYIVMEHVSGESLKSRFSNSKTDLSDILSLAEKIGAGLSAAHKLGIVHRDIKADNVLINDDGEPKILDFGLAKFSEGSILQDSNNPNDNIDDDDGDTISRELTQAGKIVGTVTYMSPEQARGEVIDTRSDIFSFGVLLYRMAAGEFPFSGPTQVSTLAKILEATQEAPSAKNSAIPPELERIITKCLQKNPADRYQDTRDMVLDIRSLRKQFDSGITDSFSSISSPAITLSKTYQFKGKAAWLSAVALIAFVGIYFYFPFGEAGDADETGGSKLTTSGGSLVAAENSIAILDFANKTNDTELQWLESGLPEILLTDLTENRALNVISRTRILDHVRAKNNSAAEATAEEMREACVKIGAGSIISGSYYKLGDKIRIDARLEETSSGAVIWSQKVVGEDLFTLVDSLTEKISHSLNVADLAPSDQQVSNVLTSSPEAYRLYLEATEQLLSDRHEQAQANLLEALRIDSTFGMAYMRLGLSHFFSGHNQQGLGYVRKAQEFANNMPVRSKSLLDIYVDVFVNTNYTDGFAKMESYIKNYPDDKEARTMYGALLDIAKSSDTLAAYAQFDTVLAQDPTYQFALSMYANMASQRNDFDRAGELLDKLLRFHPESPEPYTALINHYYSQNKTDEAIEMCQRMRNLFPKNTYPFATLVNSYLKKKQFDSAAHYNELYGKANTDDHFSLITYHTRRATLLMWDGKFIPALGAMKDAVGEARATSDSARISSALRGVGETFHRIEMNDSAVHYAHLAQSYNLRVFNAPSYPLSVIAYDHAEGMKLKPVFDSILTDFRAQVPQGMWFLVDGLKMIYQGAYDYDTLKALEGFHLVNSVPKFLNGGNLRGLAQTQVEYGQNKEALETLEKVMSGRFETVSGYSVPLTHYLLGRAYEGVGKNDKAVESYQEMLKYWSDPDIVIEIIADARERLARLKS